MKVMLRGVTFFLLKKVWTRYFLSLQWKEIGLEAFELDGLI